jgi:hypothetical protein
LKNQKPIVVLPLLEKRSAPKYSVAARPAVLARAALVDAVLGGVGVLDVVLVLDRRRIRLAPQPAAGLRAEDVLGAAAGEDAVTGAEGVRHERLACGPRVREGPGSRRRPGIPILEDLVPVVGPADVRDRVVLARDRLARRGGIALELEDTLVVDGECVRNEH